MKNTKEKNIKKASMLQALKFLLFSIGAGIIQFTSFTICFELLNFTPWLCHTIAITLSVIFSFTLNRKFTFQAANNVKLAMILVIIFYIFFTPLSLLYVKELSEIATAEFQIYLIELSAMVINLILEFIYNKFFVYGKKLNKNVSNLK